MDEEEKKELKKIISAGIQDALVRIAVYLTIGGLIGAGIMRLFLWIIK